ncbi:Methyltransferase corrinoid activation protein [Olavius sp. associated proteobacterium Delta 1]|nr:Methyltransferase corrinoid activation protein [Olavius sp. associated proteobacterium Delta 1]
MNNADSPWIKTISLPPPSLQDNTADTERLISALRTTLQTDAAIHIDFDLIKKLPDILRQNDFNVRCTLFKDVYQWLVVGIQGASEKRPVAGLAVDLGTSRVVLRLLDLTTGQTLAESGFDNPQLTIGPDILSRIHFTDSSDGLTKLNDLIITGLNNAIKDLCQSKMMEPQDIYALAVAGNTTMTHLLMGLNPRWIIREPYIPVVNRPGILKAAELGLQLNPAARIFVFPNIGSYFGGDMIAGILFAGLHCASDTAILVDVGTNAEVVVGNHNWLIACAGAAGPALEGGVTKMGMMAGPGVVDKISIDPPTREFDLHTIEDNAPKGICGSGVIDLAAQLYLSGMLDIRGKLIPAVCGKRLKKIDGLMHLVVIPADQSASGADLTVSQADLDSLIRSKAAMYTILETITMSVGMELKNLTTFYVAGTFGSFIDPRSAITIGMMPDLPLASYKPLGNSSLGGATLALTSEDSLAEINRIRDRITYLELNVNQDFMNRFSAAKFIPHTNAALFPSVKVKPDEK